MYIMFGETKIQVVNYMSDPNNLAIYIDPEEREMQDIYDVASESDLSTIKIYNDDENLAEVCTGFTSIDGFSYLPALNQLCLTLSKIYIDDVKQSMDVLNSKIDSLQKDYALQTIEFDDIKEEVSRFKDCEALVRSTVYLVRMQARNLSDTDALQVKNLYNPWEKDPVGYEYSMDNPDDKRRTHNDRLWNLQKSHKKQEDWYPGADPTLWMEVVEGHEGTLEDPIPVPDSVTTSGFEYEYGKYYSEGDHIYLAKREGKNDGEKEKLFFAPSSLIGQYFEMIQ